MIAFQSEEAKRELATWYPRFRAKIPADVEERDVPTRFGTTHVTLAGPPGVEGPADTPPLVVLHGAFASSAHVLSECGPLLRTRRVIAPDIIGRSPMSDDGELPMKGPAYGEWLSDVLDGLGVEQADLFGVSWGGFAARKAATVAPHRFRRLVLLVPAGVVGTPALPALWRVGLPVLGWKLFGRQASLRAFAEANLTTMDEDWIGWLGDALRKFKSDFEAPPLATPEDVAPWKGPVLLIAATDDVHFPGEPMIARIRELFPQAEVERVAGKHSPPMDDSFREWLAARIARFLA